METRFCVITTGRNCLDWIERTLASIATQRYPKELVKVCVTDDASTDGSGELIKRICQAQGWEFFINDDRRYALANQYRAIHHICDVDEDVIVFVDADDWLNGVNVFRRLDEEYSDPNILMTYGCYATHPEVPENVQPGVSEFPPKVIAERSFRKWQQQNGIIWNHLRTFRYGPFKSIKESELQYPDGRGFFHASPDTALMVPMLELVGSRHRMIKDKLLVYNTLQAEPDWRTHSKQIMEADSIIFNMPQKEEWNAKSS